MRKTGIHLNEIKYNEKLQAGFLRKHFRCNEFYRQIGDKEKLSCEKQIASIVHEFVIDEEVNEFSLSELHQYLIKMCYNHN